jgi:hypothetical protein
MEAFQRIFDRVFPLSDAGRAEQEAARKYEEQVLTALLSVDQLRTSGQNRAALHSCGQIMKEAVKKWNPWGGGEAPKHLQLAAQHMARILAYTYPSDVSYQFHDITIQPCEYCDGTSK